MIDTKLLTFLATNAKFTDDAILIDASHLSNVRSLILAYESHFASWAYAMNKKATIIRSNNNEVRIPAALAVPPIESIPQDEISRLLWFANVAISPAILSLANDLMNNPRRAGITRVSDELQIIMTDGCKILNPRHTMQEATTWTRSQFWHPQDLIEFRRECRQQLTDDGITTLEFTWRSFDPDLGIDCKEPGNWLEFTTQYRLFNGGDGDFYQLCENLGMTKIEPVIISHA